MPEGTRPPLLLELRLELLFEELPVPLLTTLRGMAEGFPSPLALQEVIISSSAAAAATILNNDLPLLYKIITFRCFDNHHKRHNSVPNHKKR